MITSHELYDIAFQLRKVQAEKPNAKCDGIVAEKLIPLSPYQNVILEKAPNRELPNRRVLPEKLGPSHYHLFFKPVVYKTRNRMLRLHLQNMTRKCYMLQFTES